MHVARSVFSTTLTKKCTCRKSMKICVLRQALPLSKTYEHSLSHMILFLWDILSSVVYIYTLPLICAFFLTTEINSISVHNFIERKNIEKTETITNR